MRSSKEAQLFLSPSPWSLTTKNKQIGNMSSTGLDLHKSFKQQ